MHVREQPQQRNVFLQDLAGPNRKRPMPRLDRNSAWVEQKMLQLFVNRLTWIAKSDRNPTPLFLPRRGVMNLETKRRKLGNQKCRPVVKSAQFHRLPPRNVPRDERLLAGPFTGDISHIAMMDHAGIVRANLDRFEPGIVEKQRRQQDLTVIHKPGGRDRVVCHH